MQIHKIIVFYNLFKFLFTILLEGKVSQPCLVMVLVVFGDFSLDFSHFLVMFFSLCQICIHKRVFI